MITYQKCDGCGIHDITFNCKGQQLCPTCAGKLYDANPETIRAILMEKYASPLDTKKFIIGG